VPATNNFPLAQDTAVFDDTGSAGTVTVQTFNIGAIDMSARTSAMTLQGIRCANYLWQLDSLALALHRIQQPSPFQVAALQRSLAMGGFWPITIDCGPGTVQLADALELAIYTNLDADLWDV
jgi:hypothetical protein